MKKQAPFIRLGLASCLVLSLLVTVQPARAASLTVCPFSNVCLYQSIKTAVAAAQVGDTIAVKSGTYLEHDIAISMNLTISGDGSGSVTLNAGGNGRGFKISSGATVSISGMTITNGKVVGDNGGGISSNGDLILIDTIVTNNSADLLNSNDDMKAEGGGIYASGFLTMTNSQVTYNHAAYLGAGIALSMGTEANLTNVLIQHNTAQDPNDTYSGSGAGIYLDSFSGTNASNLYLYQTTVDNNTANRYGGGIFIRPYAKVFILNSTISNNHASEIAGIWSQTNSQLIMTNDTISGNDAGTASGGGLTVYGTASLTNVTVAGNHAGVGGGILDIEGTVNLQDSIVAGNTASSGEPDCYGTLQSQDYNLIGNANSCTISGMTAHNILGVPAKLGALANNGGPTQTMALLSGSPAINAANNSTCMGGDQRGALRPVGAACDMGAFELRDKSITTFTLETPDPSAIGQNVILLITVSGGTKTPTGTVVTSGADSNCSMTLSSGVGRCMVSFSSSGTRTLTASYSGDASHEPSTATTTHQVLGPGRTP